jgi:hypothetical protein
LTVDLDALLAPIDSAPDTKAARSAVWDVLRQLKYGRRPAASYSAADDPWADYDARKVRMRERLDMIAAIDAAAWAAGCSEGFRAHALADPFCGCINSDEEETYSVIPASFPEMARA